MSDDYDHEFDPLDLIETIRNARAGDAHGLPRRLEATLPCLDCGEVVDVKYDLHYVGDEEVTGQ